MTASANVELQFSGSDVEDLVTFWHLPSEEVCRRLQAYRFADMAQAWRLANPTTPAQMRAFYATTDLYIWELMQWHASGNYDSRWHAAQTVISLCPPASHAHVLDYGCGVGTMALRYAEAGYEVTIADLPGQTLRFAVHRFKRRGLPVRVLEIEGDDPPLSQTYDLLICMDVLEHLPFPDRTMFKLGRHVRAGGMAALLAAWGRNEDFPHHLEENCRKYGDTGNWRLVMNAAGFDDVENMVYRKVGGRKRMWGRALRYRVWERTGLFLARIRRYPEDYA